MSSIKQLINKMPEKQLDDFAKSVQEVQEGNPSPSINGSGSEDTPEITAAKARVDTLNAEGSTATEEEKAAAQKALDDLLAASKIPGENAASGENVDAGAVDSEKSGENALPGAASGENALPGADAIDPENARTQKQEQIKSLEEKLKSMDDGEEKAKIEAEIATLKEEISKMVGGRRRTRRHNKKGDKKSRRQSKKGGKKHRKSAKKGSSKSKRSRRYSSRK